MDESHDTTTPNDYTDDTTVANNDISISEVNASNSAFHNNQLVQSSNDCADDTRLSNGDTIKSQDTVINGMYNGSHNATSPNH